MLESPSSSLAGIMGYKTKKAHKHWVDKCKAIIPTSATQSYMKLLYNLNAT